MPTNDIYALDFDGVICHSAVETAITGWKAAGHFWSDMPALPSTEAIDQFALIRPLIETGYEAILGMRLLFLGYSCAEICADYSVKIKCLIEDLGVETETLKHCFGTTRDAWIAEDINAWLAMNPLFPGVQQKLQALTATHTWYIITTKQERFVHKILHANAIDLAPERIFGLDRKLTKAQVLNALLAVHPGATLTFVEDRLATLETIQRDPSLRKLNLGLACWGYNTDHEQTQALTQGVTLLSLANFLVFPRVVS
ncbi:MAG: HAD family hydrolase [Methylovulum sp.]|jgi:phosphoglycolate phosphatase-like HAD superfamily hydrolase|nr:HAD family hydrolase [Methylovulum sp.]